jgi:hypothetical protein
MEIANESDDEEVDLVNDLPGDGGSRGSDEVEEQGCCSKKL